MDRLNFIRQKKHPMNQFKLALFGIGLFINISVWAQPESFGKKLITKFELVAGAGILNNSETREGCMLLKYGYSIGAGASHSFNESIEFGIRALWELKGSKVKREITQITPDSTKSVYTQYFDTNLNYFTALPYLTFKMGRKKNAIAGLGGYYSLLRRASVTEIRTDQLTDITTTYRHRDIDNFQQKWDAGISVFIGYTIPVTHKSNCVVQLMYNKGLFYVRDSWNGNHRNNALLLVLSFNVLNSLGRNRNIH